MAGHVLLEVKGMTKSYTDGKGALWTAVDHVDLTVEHGEWIGIVGESGSGKSTLARLLCHLDKADAGKFLINGQDAVRLRKAAGTDYYKNLQMIFQDPLSTFSPRMRIGDYISEPFINFKLLKKKEAAQHAIDVLASVGLPAEMADKYPHELSGGQLQRVCIARAVGVKPDLLICDECTSALDVSTQQQVIQYIVALNKTSPFANIFITHDIALAESICDRLYVMQAGKFVEMIESGHLVRDARHPYTKKLVTASLALNKYQQNGRLAAFNG